MMKVLNLTTEYKNNPLGIAVLKPRLSWLIKSDESSVMQTAYQIKVASSLNDLLKEENLLWDTQKVDSDQSVLIEYKGKSLKSRQKVYWNVKVWDNQGNESVSNTETWWEMGMLEKSTWKAKWITADMQEDTTVSTPCIYLRKNFNSKSKIKNARVYASAMGLYQLSINGTPIGNELFTPGWTSYQKRIQYQVFDVTQSLSNGENVIGAILGDGWFRGYFVWQGEKNLYGDKTALFFQMHVEYENGESEVITSDDTWTSNTGPILSSDIYNGESYDARLEVSGWNLSSFNDSKWFKTTVINNDVDMLVASEGEPVRITETIKPVEKIITPKGEVVFDLGQNIVGWVRFNLKGEKGDGITLHHAEVLDSEGNFYTDNLREAKAEDNYIFKGEGREIYEPHFTFHGFRYIRVSNYKGEVGIDDLEGRVIHSDMNPIGYFECSDPLVNRLQKNIQWGLRGNFLDVPTDCPQRDERLGWTGDAQVFAPTACFNMNTASFFTKWMKDYIIEQKEDGSVPWVVPNVVKDGGGTGWSDGFGATGWADAAVIIPWTVYLAYGDKRILENQYQSMSGWVEYMIKHAGERYIFDYGFHFGDWLSFAEYSSYNYNAPDYGYAGAFTEKDLIATAYFYHSTSVLEKTSRVLDKQEEANRLASLLPKIKSAFQKEFMTTSGRMVSGTQTAYVLSLAFDLVPENLKSQIAKKLADDVRYFGHLTTGFLGTPLICQALTDNGYSELAYQLLFNDRYPSWLFPVTKGATTIWERWDGIKPDGTFQTVGMNSFNHYAYGAVGNWLYNAVAGINSSTEKTGYKEIIIQPYLTNKLDFAKATLQSPYGEISSKWERLGGRVRFTISIPVNTNATFIYKTDTKSLLNKSENQNIEIERKDDYSEIKFGSGKYIFEV